MHESKIIGPYFFEDPTVNGNNYKRMLRYYAVPKIAELPGNVIFQQDGAPPHYATQVRSYLDRKFGDRWIGRGGPVAWPPRSPDLTPLDFFLWGHVKDQVYSVRISSLTHLKTRITQTLNRISTATLTKVWKNTQTRLDYVVRQNGGHIEQLLA